jgi:TPR repeat protein
MDLGYPDAFSASGFFYANGRGDVEKNDAKAFEFFQKGADLGSQAAQVNLGRFYLEGRGVGADREKGLALMEAAASAGSKDAHAALAEIYFLGLYDEASRPDFQKALPHVEESAKSGNDASINMLGVMYREGHAVDKDSMRAEELFRKAAMLGNFKAQTNLAELIDPSSKKRGKRIESAAWYIIASRQGEPMAVYQIENLQTSFDKKEFEEAKALAEKFQAQIQSK